MITGNKICKFYNNSLGGCMYGDKCNFVHIEKNLNLQSSVNNLNIN